MAKVILSIDPGTKKYGIAILDETLKVLEKKIVEAKIAISEILALIPKYVVKTIIIGNGSGSKDLKKSFANLNISPNVVFVSEKFSTLEARKRYFKDNPPAWFLKIIPLTLLVPPCPIDDYAAIILGENFLKGDIKL